MGALEIRVWNGTAEIHLNGATVPTGAHVLPAGRHNVAALIDGHVLEDRAVDVSPDERVEVDFVVPPPRAPLAVVIENSVDARPQSGLDRADVVYEALAEGGIARFLAIYLAGDAPVVGPVRSLRHYFAFFAAEYEADLVHIGASPQGFAWRDAMNMGKLDESAGDPGIWRSPARAAPHNAYTDTAADRAWLSARGRQQGRSWGPLLLAEPPWEPQGEPAERPAIAFRPWAYSVSYQWDPSLGRYRRFMSGYPHVDAITGAQLTAASVVVQITEVAPIWGDPLGRIDMALSEAGGQLYVFSQGVVRRGTWTKGLPHEPTQWLDEAGQPFALPHGTVWVEVVPTTGELTW